MQPDTQLPKRYVKRYIAKINQTSTNDPTAIEYINEIGNIVWTRTGIGTYRATLTGAFAQTNDVWIGGTLNGHLGRIITTPNTDYIAVSSYNTSLVLTDGMITRWCIQIDIYHNY